MTLSWMRLGLDSRWRSSPENLRYRLDFPSRSAYHQHSREASANKGRTAWPKSRLQGDNRTQVWDQLVDST